MIKFFAHARSDILDISCFNGPLLLMCVRFYVVRLIFKELQEDRKNIMSTGIFSIEGASLSQLELEF